MKTSIGVLPAPAPSPAAAASMRVAPTSSAAQAVGHAHGQVVVAVEAQFGFRLERIAHRGQAGFDRVGQQVAGRVGDVDAVGAVALHQLGLLRPALRGCSCAPSSGSRRCPCRACGPCRCAARETLPPRCSGWPPGSLTRRSRAPSSGGPRCRCPAAAAPRPWPASSAGSPRRGIPRRCGRGNRSSPSCRRGRRRG